MPLTQQLALVPDGVKVSSSELTRVASALSKQVEERSTPVEESGPRPGESPHAFVERVCAKC